MTETMAPIHDVSKRYEDNLDILKEELGIGKSYDIGLREFRIGGKKAAIIFVDGLINDLPIAEIMQNFACLEREEIVPDTLQKLVSRYITYVKALPTDKLEDVISKVLAGFIALMVDGMPEIILIEARKYPARGPEEPDIERVVRGSRDGFTETILFNTALLRRRLRDPRLRTELLTAGARSKTDICVAYIEDVANPELVETIKTRIKDIKIDGLPMAEKSVEEYITTGNWNPLPQVRYTERPDVAAVHLLEGHVLVIVDTSPSVIIAPATYFHHLQHAEEYRQNATVGAYLRWVRFIAVFSSILLLPLWYLAANNPQLLPESLKFIGPSKVAKIPLIWQFMIAEVGLDMLRMSAIHTPSPLATALGLIAAFMLGDVAITVGLFNPETILYMAISAVGTFATPSYELGLANRLFRFGLLIMVALMGLPGLLAGVAGIILLLTLTKPFGIPYLWPLIPFNGKALLSILLRSPVPMHNFRPSILKPKDSTRQPNFNAARKPVQKNMQKNGQKNGHKIRKHDSEPE
ncbi:spore germination protein [Phosphitispora fastidiosa]|uniref:spore germination protein n=1 Tax=Phosphitispora fastidiosa TaxID=2837202 RepID=UPI001E616776|nr:spore germination protein [Phosphitispora fastidiosa]MBU7007718.1 stage V sporulation protein AF [Phosphitispora fastidiosa]